MEIKEILQHVDHTLLTQTAVWEEIRQICQDAVNYHTASVCIPPCFVQQAAGYLKGRVAVCTVIGFPNGYMTTEAKEFEARDAIARGADEIDMVINIGWLKERDYGRVEEEIRRLKSVCGSVTAAGADYIKTSTGFSGGGATFDDVALFAQHVGAGVKIKAAGGISSLADAERFLELGADRLGTSRIVKLVKQEAPEGY